MDMLKERIKGFGIRELTLLVAFTMSAYHITVGYIGEPVAEIHRPVHTLFAILVLYLGWERLGTPTVRRLKLVRDLALSGMMVAACAYIFINFQYIYERMQTVDPVYWYEQVLGVGLILLLFEASRRSIGWTIIVVCTVFLFYARFGFLLPDPFYHAGYGLDRIVEHMYMVNYGIWGTPIAVTASFVFLFVFYGSLLLSSGAGDFFTDLAKALTGRQTGGPAKTAVVSSALMGTLTGSSAANVVTTGSFTIPAMREAGYHPQFAAGVEAAASAGGQLTPPIMGSAAFIMMEFLAISYFEVMKLAILPALLYFISCFFMVDLEARREGLRPRKDLRLPKVWDVIKKRGYLLLSIFALLYYLYLGYTPAKAAFWAIAYLACLVVIFDPESRRRWVFALFPVAWVAWYIYFGFTVITPAISGALIVCTLVQLAIDGPLRKRFAWIVWDAATNAPKLIAPVTVACALGGIIVGVITLTALGDRLTSLILDVAEVLPMGQVFATLVMSTVLGVVLGMGMPTSGAYIVLATLLAPALAEMGVHILAAHMFLMWVASKSSITPPVAIASYAAAAVAGTDPWKTSMTGFRIALPIFIVPYMFTYGPSLLMMGEPMQILWSFATATIGVFILAVACIGWLFIPLRWFERIPAILAAGFLLFAGPVTDAIGLSLAAIIALVFFVRARFRERVGVAAAAGAGEPGAGE